MASSASCPECGASEWKQEGEYALLKILRGNTLQFNAESMQTDGLVVHAAVCGSCSYVKLYEA